MKEETSQQISRQIAITAILLAICIVSQVLKNLSVYITGPIVNLCLILAAMTAGLMWGIILGVITPLTAYFIAASPVMSAVPGIILLIMLGNIVLVVMTSFLVKPAVMTSDSPVSLRAVIMALLASLAKGCVMGATISLWLLPSFISEGSPLREKLPIFQTTFSITQFVTAVIGFVYLFIIWKPVSRML